MKNKTGQLTDEEFKRFYPNARINTNSNTATTKGGKYTINFWMQHADGSWTNYDCKTKH